MLMAQLHGKLSEEVWSGAEDLLTSAIFGSLQYVSDSLVRGLLGRVRFLTEPPGLATDGPLSWRFWPSWKRCEPDVVLEDTHNVWVFEAKLYTDFGQDDEAGHQLRREWSDGSTSAKATGKRLWLIAVTNHAALPHAEIERQLAGSAADPACVGWLGWLEVGRFLRDNRSVGGVLFEHMLELLSRMGLAPFDGFDAAIRASHGLSEAPCPWTLGRTVDRGTSTDAPHLFAAAITAARRIPPGGGTWHLAIH